MALTDDARSSNARCPTRAAAVIVHLLFRTVDSLVHHATGFGARDDAFWRDLM